jgi:hypothetical protein
MKFFLAILFSLLLCVSAKSASFPIYLVTQYNSDLIYVDPDFGPIYEYSFPAPPFLGVFDLQVSHDLGTTWSSTGDMVVFDNPANPPLLGAFVNLAARHPSAYRFWPVETFAPSPDLRNRLPLRLKHPR